MAETFGFFDAEELTDGTFDREYIAEQWANYFKLFVGNGVFATPTNQLKVVAYTGMFVKISIGWAFINGYWYHNDTELEVEIPANMTASTITDGIFIRWDSANREIKAVVGVNRTTPNRVAPYYELKLADIVVATGATQITDAEITDTRMDSSVCGIVTGVIEVIDAGNLFAQYQAIFTQWMNSTDTDFDEWRDNQEALYTQWYNAIKAQQTQDLEDFDAWFDAIKGQLSEDAAGHLQNEIDDIIAQGLSGSIFTITTTQTELYGKDVTITGSNVTKTGKFSAQGVAVITGFIDVGTITITSTDNLETATTVMAIPYFGRYTATLAFWSATVNLEGSESLYGSTVTVKDSDNLTVGTVVLSVLDGTGVFTATAPDTYTFITTYEGETLTWELEVSQETTYNLELSVGFNWQAWLTAGSVDPTDYEDLDEVLEDEKALWKLFTKHSSVDYLADVSETDSNITKIFNNDLVAKWINLRDYALDTLHANEVLAEVMGEADKYGYGEWALMPQVPTMTSNTAPSGECFGKSRGSSNDFYYAFDGNDSTFHANSDQLPSTEHYIGYKFTETKHINEARVLLNTQWAIASIKIQGSNDGTTYTDISETIENPTRGSVITIPCTSSASYLYIRAFMTGTTSSRYGVNTLQFYAWAPKGNVPVMTSNTAPYGEASAKDYYNTGVEAYRAFDGNPSTYWSPADGTDTKWIQYKFTNPICVRKVFIDTDGSLTVMRQRVSRFEVVASNDGSTWTEPLASISTDDITDGKNIWLKFNNTSYYLYYRVNEVKKISAGISFYSLQFYGRELKVSVPVMTSNTAPFGVVSSNRGGSDNWKVFAVNQWAPDSTVIPSYIQYDFGFKVLLRMAQHIYAGNGGGSAMTFNMTASEDGVNWDTIVDNYQRSHNTPVNTLMPISSNKVYRYVRINCTSKGTGAQYALRDVKFYGFDYSERDFDENLNRKTLYDHGVELEELSDRYQGTAAPVHDTNSIILASTGSNQYCQVYKSMDLTNYDLIRAKADRYAASNAKIKVEDSDFNSSIAQVEISTNGPLNSNLDISSIDQVANLMISNNSSASVPLELVELWLEGGVA